MKIDVRKKILNLAVASAVGVAGLASIPAQAMNVSQQGLGQVLLFPYYTAKNGFDTVFTVTNTSNQVVVAKVRWREALNSREVRDFNVIMSPHDVWTGAVTLGADGQTAAFRTYDKTCTSPALPNSATAAGAKEIAFSNAAYTTTPPFTTDKGTGALSRTQEGYFEIIEMGVFAAGDETAAANEVAFGSVHVNGTPRNCAYIDTSVLADYDGTNANALQAPIDVLKGAVSYINVASGQAIEAPVTAIEGFSDGAAIWFAPGDLQPSLADGDAAENADYFAAGNGYTTDAIATTSEDTISVMLMADAVLNEFASDGVGALTSWIVTYPTKHFYTDGVAVNPFSNDFVANGGQSCDDISFTMYDREEKTVTVSTGNVFSPAPNGAGPAQLCYEANVITFNGANIFGSGTNRLDIDTTAVGTAGWGALTLVGQGDVNGNAVTFGAAGLPVIGFAAVLRNNSTEAGNNRNYGSTVPHSFARN